MKRKIGEIRQSGARPPRPRAISVQDLGKLEGLAGLPLRKLEALRARMTVRQFSKRSIIHEEGQSGGGPINTSKRSKSYLKARYTRQFYRKALFSVVRRA
jgi:hypothetical protein